MSRTRSHGRHRQLYRPEDGSGVLLADDLAAADPQTRIRATSVAFYGRTAHAVGASDGQAEWHRQLALCRSVVAARGGQVAAVYFDEGCRADHPWNCRPQGQALLAALSGPAHPAWTLVAADAWRLLPRRTPADGAEILHQLGQRHVLLVLADTGAAVSAGGEYALIGVLMLGTPAACGRRGPAAMPLRFLPSAAVPAAPRPRGGEPG